MKTTSTVKPYRLELHHSARTGRALLAFNENIISEDTEDGIVYKCDTYYLDYPHDDLLEQRVSDRYDEWLGMAKQAEYDKLASKIKYEREKLLTETDWTQALDAPIGPESREELRIYRQALRDITEQPDYPHSVEWPEQPEIIKAIPDPVDEAFDVLVGGGMDA